MLIRIKRSYPILADKIVRNAGMAMFFLFLLLSNNRVQAQTPVDGFTMSKGELCLVTDYGTSSWKEYWEGTLLRENKNLGTFTSTMVMPMAGYGLNSKINLFAGLPYISNRSDAGTMAGMRGIQDLSLAVKYKLFRKKTEKSLLQAFATGGFSLPVSDYVPDHLPFSIGLGARTVSGRAIIQYERKKGLFIAAQTGYVHRSRITVARQSYFNERQVMSNIMPVPDVWDGSVRFGFNNKKVRAALHYAWMTSTTGSDIRRNDMPYPFNRMNARMVGASGLYWIHKVEGLSIRWQVDKVIAGRNVGRSFGWSAGFQYVFTPFKEKS